eukprot:3908484-Pyramimonas_sp.AAC.1
MVLHGDTAMREALAPATQCRRMLWRSQAFPDKYVVTTAQLFDWWRAAVHDPGLGAKWFLTRGPLQRAALSIGCAGWQALSGYRWLNHNGEVAQVDQLTPVMLQRLLKGLCRQRG